MPDQAVEIRYRGVDRAGRGHTGVTTIPDLPAWTETKYRQGYRQLSVWIGANEANEIAGITQSPDSGARIWWSQTHPLTPATVDAAWTLYTERLRDHAAGSGHWEKVTFTLAEASIDLDDRFRTLVAEGRKVGVVIVVTHSNNQNRAASEGDADA